LASVVNLPVTIAWDGHTIRATQAKVDSGEEWYRTNFSTLI
jgi:hypothetical protein